MAASSASACASVTGGGSCIGARRRIDAGITASTSAAREAAPTTDSMCRCSASVGPMWRA